MARHARTESGVVAHPVVHRARAAALVVVATVVVGAALGLLFADGEPTAANVLDSATSAPLSVPSRDLALPADDRPSARPGPTTPAASPTVAAGPTDEPSDSVADGEIDWFGVLTRLDARRAEAFDRGDAGLLATVYVAGSQALERDAAALAKLTAAGLRSVGLALVVDEVAAARAGPDEVVLYVVDRMPGYQLVRPDGSVAETRAARGPAAWLVTLRGGGGDWRIAAITSA